MQVYMLKPLANNILVDFSVRIYDNMFSPGTEYWDTQVGCILTLGTATELGERLDAMNPHADFDGWKFFTSRTPVSKKGHKTIK